MSIFEYIFERKNPGSVGSIERNKESFQKINIPVVLIKLVFSVALIYGLFYVTVLQNLTLWNVIIFIIIMLLYCTISYQYIPKPDTSNMGLFGGLIDHPFKYTDDINRSLLFFSILLYPGRFISKTTVQTFILIKRYFIKGRSNNKR